ncbi:MAG: SRPBCC domain-containing protein [Bacteroidales bacterium]|jgi:uncharacterized protein YndB with AHSA1/START domain|nr:SRPBCC domain-containing protein [Bacteroidales bacterium]
MKDFKYKVKMKAELEDIWMAFTSASSMELWTGYYAEFKPEPGCEFSLWEGDITGKVLEVIPQEKLVEQWYFEGENVESVATLKFFHEKNKVTVELSHTNIPDEAFENITEGWVEYYLGAIKTFVEVG